MRNFGFFSLHHQKGTSTNYAPRSKRIRWFNYLAVLFFALLSSACGVDVPTAAPTALTAAPAITSVTVATNRTSLLVEVALADDSVATVSCAAFAAPRTLKSVTDITAQGHSGVSSKGLASVPIANLYASTGYYVYCTSSSLAGAPLSLAQAQATATSTATLCCKYLTVRVLTSSLVASTSAPGAVSVTLEAPPSKDLNMVASFAGGSTYPTSISWTSSSSVASPQLLSANAGVSGGAKPVTVVIAGTSVSEYTVRYAGSNIISVIASSEEPAVPEVASAQFSSDGTYIALTFNAATNKGGFSNAFPCGKLLTFAGSAASTCQWSDSASIRIYPQASTGSASAELSVSTFLTLIGDQITADCSSASTDVDCASWEKVPTTLTSVRAPSQPTLPVVSISAPASVGACNSLTIDLASSTGSAGRTWASVTFKVAAASSATAVAARMEAFLNKNYTISPPTAVPSSVLQSGVAYSITATLCNFLGACGSKAVSVSVLSDQDLVPIVSILGASQRSVYRSTTLTLSSNAYTQVCGGAPSYANLDLTWTVSNPSGGDASAGSIRSSSLNAAVFKLSPYSLKVGQQYTIALAAKSRASGLTSSASVTVTVAASGLVAKIAGGATRSVRVGDELSIDASSSYDQDVQSLTGTSAGLIFSWTCVQNEPVFSTDCPLVLPSTTDEKFTLTAPPESLNTTSLLTLTVQDTARARSSTAQVTVKASGFLSPVLSVSSALSTVSNVNTDNKLVLLGSAQIYATCTAVWSVDDASVSLSTIATTSTSTVLQPAVRPVAFNLVVAGGTLPQRATLVFTLSCGSTANSLTVTTNGAPLPGLFMLRPAEGDELSTVFQFSASQWTDTDLPLTYQFGFESVTSLANLVVVSNSELSFTSTTLPAGPHESANRLNCTLHVYDSLGMSSLATAWARVNELSSEQQQESLLAVVKSGTGSVDSFKNIISVVSAALNAVNCSAAPDCVALNREPCLKTSGACGVCADGFIGDAGDRSTLCIPAHFAYTNATNAACNTQDHCLSWQVCENGQCVVPQKSCSNDCSMHGSCLYTSLVTGATLDTCSLADLSCAAACSCSDGYSGPTCAVALADLQSRREIRSNLVSVLHNLTQIENADVQSVSSWSASLYSVALNPYDLSENDAAQVLQVANVTMQSAKGLSLDSAASLIGVLQATDTVFSVQKYNYNPNDFNDAAFNSSREAQNNTAVGIIEVVGAFADLQAQFMVLGEDTVSYFYDNFRVSSQLQVFSADSASNLTVSSPQSSFERQTDTAVATAVLTPSTGSTSTSSIAVSVITVSPGAYSPDTSAFKSNPLYLQVTSDSGEEASSVVSSIEFSFPFNERQDQFVAAHTANFTFTCETLEDEFSFPCPDSTTVLVSNCSAGLGEYVKFCPRQQPSCAQLDTTTGTVTAAPSCRVVSYNTTYVTCACGVSDETLNSGRRSRRLASSAESDIIDKTGVSNMIATAVYISMEFADTFNAAGRFNDPAAVIIVIIMFATLWGAGLILLSACFGRSYLSMQHKLSLLSKQVVAAISNVENGQAMDDARDRLLTYVENVIPSVYSEDKSNIFRLFSELRSHHKYLTLFTLGDGQKTAFNKVMLILQTLTMETMQMFLLAMLYDLQEPDDDGSCPKFTNQDDCLDRKSIFDRAQTYCQWRNDAAGQAKCSFHNTSFSPSVFIYILILTSIFTAIINTPLDYFFKVCSAPLIEDAMNERAINTKKNSRLNAVAEGLRRISMHTNHAVHAVGRRGSAAVVSTQQYVQKKFRLQSIHLSSKEREADAVIADRTISEDLQQMHKHAVAGSTALVQHSNNLQTQREKHSQRLLNKAQSKRGWAPSNEDKIDESLKLSEPRDAKGTYSSKSAAADAATALEAAAGMRKVMRKLQDEVLCQRLLLPADSEHIAMFDAQWGVVPTAKETYVISDEALEAIQGDVECANEEAQDLNERMLHYTLQHGGLSILNLFLLDLLGRRTIAAKIFKNKFEEDFAETHAVSQAYKGFAIAFLLACNGFFIYYTLLKALQKGHTWQYQFLRGCIAQMLVEIFLNETLECVWLNYMVPDLARKEVQRVHTVLKQVIEQITDKANDVHKKTLVFLNAPSYLFSSTKVAQAHPNMLESVVVLNFQSHLPGELSRTWPHYKRWAAQNAKDEMLVDPDAALVGGYGRWWNFLFQAILAVGTATILSMQYLGTLSFDIQRIVIRIIQPLLLSGLTLLWLFASTSPVALYVVIGFFALVILAAFWRQHYLHEQERLLARQVAPSTKRDDLRDEWDSDSSSESSSTDEDSGFLHEPTKSRSQKPLLKGNTKNRDRTTSRDSVESRGSKSSDRSKSSHKGKHHSKSSHKKDAHKKDAQKDVDKKHGHKSTSHSDSDSASSASGLRVSVLAGLKGKADYSALPSSPRSSHRKKSHSTTATSRSRGVSRDTAESSEEEDEETESEEDEESDEEDTEESEDDSPVNRFAQRLSQRQSQRHSQRAEHKQQHLEEESKSADAQSDSPTYFPVRTPSPIAFAVPVARPITQSDTRSSIVSVSEMAARPLPPSSSPVSPSSRTHTESDESVRARGRTETWGSELNEIMQSVSDEKSARRAARGSQRVRINDTPSEAPSQPSAQTFSRESLREQAPNQAVEIPQDTIPYRPRADTWGAEMEEIMREGSDDDGVVIPLAPARRSQRNSPRVSHRHSRRKRADSLASQAENPEEEEEEEQAPPRPRAETWGAEFDEIMLDGGEDTTTAVLIPTATRVSQRARADSQVQDGRGRGRTETWGTELEEILRDGSDDDISVVSDRPQPRLSQRVRVDSFLEDVEVVPRNGRVRAETWASELDEIMQAGSGDSDLEPSDQAMYREYRQVDSSSPVNNPINGGGRRRM